MSIAVLYLCRAITMCVTQVPVADPNYYCSPKLKPEELTVGRVFFRALQIFSGVGLKIQGRHILCGDYIYSGHTMMLVTSSLFIREYSPRRWRILHVLSFLISTVGVVLLLVSKAHYTVDVIIAYWISTRVFWIYHTMAAFPVLRDRNSHHNHLSKVFWFPLFHWMEANVHKPVPRKFDWPFCNLLRSTVKPTMKCNVQ